MNQTTYNLAVAELNRELRKHSDAIVLQPEEKFRILSRMRNVAEEWHACVEKLYEPKGPRMSAGGWIGVTIFGLGCAATVLSLFAGAAKLSQREGHDRQKSWDGIERPDYRLNDGPLITRQPVIVDEKDWPERQHINPDTDIHDEGLAPSRRPILIDRQELPGERTEPISVVCSDCLGDGWNVQDETYCHCPIGVERREQTGPMPKPATYVSNGDRTPRQVET